MSDNELTNGNGGNLPLVLSVHQNASGDIQTSENGFTVGTTSNASARNTGKIMENNSIRRLTPEECEALQGFPKGYTLIPLSKRNKKKELKELKDYAVRTCQNPDDWKWSADGPRYKAIGNSWAVPCAAWIGRRIELVDKEIKP